MECNNVSKLFNVVKEKNEKNLPTLLKKPQNWKSIYNSEIPELGRDVWMQDGIDCIRKVKLVSIHETAEATMYEWFCRSCLSKNYVTIIDKNNSRENVGPVFWRDDLGI